MPVKTFTQGEVATAADTNTYLANGGLVYIGAATLNAVTNNISNVFSTTYDAYRVSVTNFNNASTVSRALSIRFRTTSDDQSANYFWMENYYFGANQSGFGSAAGQTSARIGVISDGASDGSAFTIDIYNPNLAVASSFAGHMITYQSDVGVYVARTIFGGINTTTQYTGFSIIGTTDALSGTVRVYGYRQA